jgi:16S rRNA (cytidine1402-2'-O)-methyltransferase
MSTKAAMECLVMAGVLYVVATPIGNLEDFSRRGASVLGSVATIAAEDTRRTRVLLEAIGVVGTPLVALHTHNEAVVSADLVSRLQAGDDVALVSDAGTPLVSDPGFELVRACWDAGLDVRPVPGASAVAAVLSVCPLPADRYLFEGFLPSRSGQRRERLRELAALDAAVVFFEAPHRIAGTLDDLAVLAPERRVMVGREMTKVHEQYLCGLPGGVRETLQDGGQLRGEFVCVLERGEEARAPAEVRRTMEILARELPPAQAARLGAALLGRNKRELYELAMTARE